MNPKEKVYKTLEGKNVGRAARQLWTLPWAHMHYQNEIDKLLTNYPNDIVYAEAALKQKSIDIGNIWEIGKSTDSWGCEFENIQRGVIGEVKNPLVKDDDWNDVENIHIPEEWLSFETIQVNEWIASHSQNKFVLSGCCPRPFEQLQFIRNTENLFVDLMLKPTKFMQFLEKMHDFYCRLITKWCQTNIDGLSFMDDWGTQRSLLISPQLWNEIFAPIYRDYIEIAHKYGKKTFMHSDGYTLDIIPKLIDLGLDAFNTQIFCMGIEKLKQFKGKITFWGEMDRQYLLVNGTKNEIEDAVKSVIDNLYDNGYAIAQCEFGAGAKPENVYHYFEAFEKLTR